MPDYSLKKSERLCNKKAFEQLFDNGITQFVYPIKAIYECSPSLEATIILVAFGSSRKSFKNAVDRNKIKRLIKEAYRKNKHILIPLIENSLLNIMFLYTAKEIVTYHKIERALIKILNEISSNLK